jgi:hypothetical protein
MTRQVAASGHIPWPLPERAWGVVRRAVATTWRTTPYYRMRFGVGAMGHSLSDTAWMMSVADADRDYAEAQLDWHRRVLANRGMPSALVDEHIETLIRHAARHRLPQVPALEELLERKRARARARLEEREAFALERRFVRATGEHPYCAAVGRWIASAAVDEASGAPRALVSLLAFLADRERFPADWCAAAEALAARARDRL